MNAQTAESLLDQAMSSIKQSDMASAQKLLNESLKIAPSAKGYHNLGVIFYQNDQIAQAVKLFQKAIAEDPKYHASHANLMRIAYSQGKISKAINHGMDAIESNQENKGYKNEWAFIASKKKYYFYNDRIKKTILSCLATNDVSHDQLRHGWLSFLGLDPKLSKIYKLSRLTDYTQFEFFYDRIKNIEDLNTPYFLSGLERGFISNHAFERFLTFLRRVILRDFLEIDQSSFDQKHKDTLTALSFYCYHTQYIFETSEKEDKEIARLRDKIGQSQNLQKLNTEIILLACYERISSLVNSKDIEVRLKADQNLSQFVKTHLSDPLEESALKPSIVSLTTSGSNISKDVQSQYEEFPYPSWRILSGPMDNVITQRLSNQKDLRMLVAGTGTGQESLSFALALPNAEILGIDLSYTSLAYAIRKTKEYGVTNITYRQADILKLKECLKPEYDFITSSGVLHHLENPLEGLDILLSLLKPKGYMHIALYSEAARQVIVRAQNLTKQKKLTGSVEDIKKFRKDAPNWLSKTDMKALSLPDYFSLPMCRDLLFHVMEHRFTLPQLDKIFQDRKLKVLEISSESRDVEYSKMFPNDSEKSSINNWHILEQKYPDAFLGMYTICLQKTE